MTHKSPLAHRKFGFRSASSFRLRAAAPLCLSLALCLPLSALPAPGAAAQKASARAPGDARAREFSPASLETLIPRLMREGEVPGLSVAVVRGGRVAWRRAFGVKNAETKEPVADDTVFQAGSLTKPVVAYAALKLVEQGRLALDKPLADYLPKPPVEGDERVRLITARHVLSHRTGFPNWRPRGGALQIHFTPGERFSYSGEGYEYLHEVVERVTGEPLQATLERLVFAPLGMKDSSVVSLDRLEAQFANGHNGAGAPLPKPKQAEANAAASLRTTAGDYARFVVAVMRGEGLKRETVAEMLRPQVWLDECVNCTGRAVAAKLSDKLAWGLGWGLQRTADGESFWHWGDNGAFKCYVVAYPRRGDALVVFTNSTNGLSIHHEIIAAALGGEQPGIAWLKYETYDSPARNFLKAVLAKGAEAAAADYRAAVKANPAARADEAGMNRVGYQLLALKRVREAVEVFKLNVEAHPQSANVYDSLAEAYAAAGERELAVRNYRRSLELDPKNANAAEALKKLEAQP